MRLFLAILAVTLGTQSVQRPAVPSNPVRIAFRYDQDRVISYIQSLRDPVPISMNSMNSMQKMAEPVSSRSSCGYLLRLTEQRLRTFTPDPQNIPPLGQRMTLLLGGDVKIGATLDGYIEEWSGDRTIVGISILAKIPSNDVARFRSSPADYFLIANASSPEPPPVVSDSVGVQWKSTTTVNRFGALGELVVRVAEAGWDITLFRKDHDRLQPTNVTYGCGD